MEALAFEQGLLASLDPAGWPTYLEGFSDTNEDAVVVAIIAQDEVSMAFWQ